MDHVFLAPPLSAARCDRIEAVRWQRGGARDAGPQLERMNRREVDYFQQYSRILTGYIEATGVDVTAVSRPIVPASWFIPNALHSKRPSAFHLSTPLLQDIQPPKRGHLVRVRAQKNCGVLVTSKGPVEVKADEVHIMWRQDAEALVLRGWLLEVSTQL